MISKEITYLCGDVPCVGFVAYDETQKLPKPAVLIVHDWSGRNQHAEEKARQLASRGYVGFAVDVYGEKALGETNEEKGALATPFFDNREMISRRMNAALKTVADMPEVDAQKIAAIGYCFGGMCVLDLARSGAFVKGVVSFHGLLDAPPQKKAVKIKPSVLVLHGYDDPMVRPSALANFAIEMNEAQVDWQLMSYGNTLHSFTNRQANDKAFGTMYSEKADRRSWALACSFLDDVLA
jgi:dienelactone hydrolase